jgi:polyisoprenoid-binding protein YceI
MVSAMNTTTTTGPTQQTSTRANYTLDASHSHAGFTVRHLMISNVRGEFQKLSGTAVFDPARPAATTLQATIDVASINTRDAQRDTHLKSADFFDVEKYPSITFVSKRATAKPGGDLEIVGDLTIHGTTREVVLAVTDITPEHKDPWGNSRIGATASTKVKRSDFGMTWNAALEAGGVLVGDEVKIQIEVELIRDK